MNQELLLDAVEELHRLTGTRYEQTAWPVERGAPASTVLLQGVDQPDQKRVLHFFTESEVAWAAGLDDLDERYFVPQRSFPLGDRLVTVREFVVPLSQREDPDPLTFRLAWQWILDVLVAMRELHARGHAHGDIRPQNVELTPSGAARLMDPGTRRSSDDDFDATRSSVPPEMRPGRAEATAPGDVYSFVRFALGLLRSFRDDADHPVQARVEGQFAWLVDFCWHAQPLERPTAAMLYDFFVRQYDVLDPRDSAGLGRLDLVVGGGALRASLMPSLLLFAPELRRYPETVFGLRTGGSEALAAITTRSELSLVGAVAEGGARWVGATVDPKGLAPVIDDRWRNRIHHYFYRRGIGPHHDEYVQQLRAEGTPVNELDRRYEQYVAAIDEVRAGLLEAHGFLHSEDVAHLLSTTTTTVPPASVVTLRRWGALLAVPDAGRWLYPTFQFAASADGLPSPWIKFVHDEHRTLLGVEPDEWELLAFWSQPRTALDGDSLAETLWSERADIAVLSEVQVLAS